MERERISLGEKKMAELKQKVKFKQTKPVLSHPDVKK